MLHLRQDVTRRVSEAVGRMAERQGVGPESCPPAEVVASKRRDHGDYSTNFALVAAPTWKRAPREIADALAEALRGDPAFAAAEIAGPGFINLRLSPQYLGGWTAEAFRRDERLGTLKAELSERYLVEFVSVNPNGPIHVGHGRGAAYGDTLCRILTAAGHKVEREFYVNDGVNSEQMRLFALSVKCRYRELLGLTGEFPEGGYRGEYVDEIARQILDQHGDGHADDGVEFFQPTSQELMMAIQRNDLARFGVVFDRWFSEQSLYDSGKVQQAIEALKERGHVYEKDGALWLRSTEFGDDKDRIVIRSDGRPTYIASDIAYHKDKFDRGYDRLINVWGADHHGYIARTAAGIQALGYERERFEVIITQIVRFLEHGQTKQMSKRDGTLVRLSDLMDEVGVDVTRFFYLMRSVDAHMDFDLDLAREQSEKNPVYYVQYAHARITSLLAKAEEAGFSADPSQCHLLMEQPERELALKIWDLPYEVGRSAASREVHTLTTYALDLARCYHNFYDKCRVIRPEDPERSAARLALCKATRSAIRSVCSLLGISAPDAM